MWVTDLYVRHAEEIWEFPSPMRHMGGSVEREELEAYINYNKEQFLKQ